MASDTSSSCLPVCNLLCGCLPVCNRLFGASTGAHGPPSEPVEVNRPSALTGNNYHIFISHRGPDSKKSLVDFLHELFILTGFTCFVDYEGIKPTENSWLSIVSAIHRSEVQIIVLSKRFEESKWCLNEVHEIMQLHSNKVLPVFYGVEPSYLDSTASALTDACVSQDSVRWASALKWLKGISGLRLDQAGGYEGQFANMIVSRAAQIVSNAPLYVNPILVDRYRIQTDDAEKRLDLSAASKAVVSLGIAGVPHVGKSTIAKLLFNKLHKQFQASSILLDVRGRARSRCGGLEDLQCQLLKDLVKEDRRISHKDEGLGLLLERLKNIKCLLVIDDIDKEEEQLRYLLVLDCKKLGRGSRLVFTSRYQEVLCWASADETLTLTSSEEVELVISYVGVEVHQGFIDHLEESFSMLGLSVCVQKGTAALQAQTKLLLVVLSKSFLTSPQLLDELNEVSNADNAMIVPILYGLKSDAVEGVLESMQPQLGIGEMWKQMLRKVLNRALHYSVDIDNLTEHSFKTLINGVLNHLQHKYAKADVAKYPVGLIERQQQLERLISKISDSRVRCVGVVGMGGVGKTTLVKALYNNIHKKFEGSALLLNVRANAAQSRLQKLQKQIIKQVLGIQQHIPSVDEGNTLLSQKLAGINTLIILDDVDHHSQLNALFRPLVKVLGQGSRVIITSRDHEILKAAVEETYEVQLLSSSDAKMLFWWHAFLRPYPPTEVQHLAQQVIDACQGLPLSLEITGAHIYGHSHNVEFWEETLRRLKIAGDIFDKLRISVDALDDQERMAFLDVSCFLIGKREETAVRLWKSCGWMAQHCLQVLKNKCLVKVNVMDGIIGMHDQVRDMGRYIVDYDQSPRRIKQLHTRSHIWDEENAMKILQTSSYRHDDMRGIRGLRWSLQEKKQCNVDAFLGLSELKLLLLSNVTVTGDFHNFCSEIRWLEWHHCNLDILPPGLCLKELSILDLSESYDLEALWRSERSDSDVYYK